MNIKNMGVKILFMIKSRDDLKYFLEQDRIALKEKKTLFTDDIWKYQILLRKAEYYSNCMPGI